MKNEENRGGGAGARNKTRKNSRKRFSDTRLGIKKETEAAHENEERHKIATKGTFIDRAYHVKYKKTYAQERRN